MFSFNLGCSSKEKKPRQEQILKAENIDTNLKNEESLGTTSSVGVDEDNNLVTQDITQVSEYLQNIRYEVFKEYEALYGWREAKSTGLAGKINQCRRNNVKKGIAYQAVPKSELHDLLNEEYRRFSDKNKSLDTNAKIKVGIDPSGKVVAASKENLLETIERYQDYRKALTKERDTLEEALATCQAQ